MGYSFTLANIKNKPFFLDLQDYHKISLRHFWLAIARIKPSWFYSLQSLGDFRGFLLLPCAAQGKSRGGVPLWPTTHKKTFQVFL